MIIIINFNLLFFGGFNCLIAAVNLQICLYNYISLPIFLFLFLLFNTPLFFFHQMFCTAALHSFFGVPYPFSQKKIFSNIHNYILLFSKFLVGWRDNINRKRRFCVNILMYLNVCPNIPEGY